MQFAFFFLSGVALLASPTIAQWQLDGRCYTWICDKESSEPNLGGDKNWTDSMCDCLGGLCKRRLGEPLAFQNPQSALYDNNKKNQLTGIQSTFEDQVKEENSDEFNRELYGSVSMSIGSKPPEGGYKLNMWWHEWSCWQYETVPRFWCAYVHATQPGDTTSKPFIDACDQLIPGKQFGDVPNDKNTFGWDFVTVSLTESPTSYPTVSPSMRPSSSPSSSMMPSILPTLSIAPSTFPSASPSSSPSSSPSVSASPTTTSMPSNSPSISFETIAMAKFIDTKEEKKITSSVLLGFATSFLVAFGILFAIATRKAKKDQIARNTRIALYCILLFSICFFVSGLTVYLIPVTLATRPSHESNSSLNELNERRVLKKLDPLWAYQIKNVRLNMCMTYERKAPSANNDDPHQFRLDVKECIAGNRDQLFTIDAGDSIWDEVWNDWEDPCKGTLETCFEVHPLADPKSCLNNPHHPKRGEKLYMEDCKVPRARGHQTHRWELAYVYD